MVMAQARARLTAESWATAALEAIGEGGLAAVAVEPLAARLGATKGSFYWHFPNRDALVKAALALWEERHTGQIIERLEAEPDPATRIRRLFREVVAHAGHDRVEVEVLAAAGNPLVRPVAEAVARRRIDYLVGQFEALGFPPAIARERVLLAYTAYMGHVQLAVKVPGVLPDPARRTSRRYADHVVDLLLSTGPNRP